MLKINSKNIYDAIWREIGVCATYYFLNPFKMAGKINRLAAVGITALSINAQAENPNLQQVRFTLDNQQGSTQIALTTADYEARIVNLTAKLAQINCKGKKGLAMLQCSGKKGALESQIRLTKKQKIGSETAQSVEARKANISEQAKNIEQEQQGLAQDKTTNAVLTRQNEALDRMIAEMGALER